MNIALGRKILGALLMAGGVADFLGDHPQLIAGAMMSAAGVALFSWGILATQR
jgi:hypothetical protein